mmetsp:Transcript_8967/g.27236  ORF Transcript_8967/g.27236 Transcript_8967/m.27236 type:complete len:257 (-) Transcript_8967:137-907(-)
MVRMALVVHLAHASLPPVIPRANGTVAVPHGASKHVALGDHGRTPVRAELCPPRLGHVRLAQRGQDAPRVLAPVPGEVADEFRLRLRPREVPALRLREEVVLQSRQVMRLVPLLPVLQLAWLRLDEAPLVGPRRQEGRLQLQRVAFLYVPSRHREHWGRGGPGWPLSATGRWRGADFCIQRQGECFVPVGTNEEVPLLVQRGQGVTVESGRAAPIFSVQHKHVRYANDVVDGVHQPCILLLLLLQVLALPVRGIPR